MPVIADTPEKRACRKAYFKAYYEKNKQRLLSYAAEYRAKNREKCLASQKRARERSRLARALEIELAYSFDLEDSDDVTEPL